MGFLLSKILTLLASPIGITVFLCGIALVLSFMHRQIGSRIFLICAMAWLWIGSTPKFADFLYGGLERAYPPVSISQLPQADAIIVLGGGVQAVAYPRDYPELNQAGDRVVYGSRLYKAGKSDKVVVSGGQVFPNAILETEADFMKTLLVDWGVADSDIITEGNSRTTYENAIETRKIADREGWQTLLLVTSAAHMPRSVCSFEKAGMQVIPAPTDYEITDTSGPFMLSIMPSSSAQSIISMGMKEYLGRWIYQLRGQC